MDIRQIALVARHLGDTEAQLLNLLGLTADEGFRDPGVAEFGLDNVVLRVGDTYLEVVSPKEEGTTAGRLLERRGGDSGYMVIVQVEDFEAHRAQLSDSAIRIVWQSPLPHARAAHLHPRDVPGAIASFDEMDPPEAWHWAGSEWESQQKARHALAILGAEITCSDPEHVAGRWALAYGRPCEDRGDHIALPFDQTELRFKRGEPGASDVLTGVDLACEQPEQLHAIAAELGLVDRSDGIVVCGVRFSAHCPH